MSESATEAKIRELSRQLNNEKAELQDEITESCDCEWAKRYPHHRSRHVVEYLRELAERCERGEIRHVSVSAHPVRRDTDA